MNLTGQNHQAILRELRNEAEADVLQRLHAAVYYFKAQGALPAIVAEIARMEQQLTAAHERWAAAETTHEAAAQAVRELQAKLILLPDGAPRRERSRLEEDILPAERTRNNAAAELAAAKSKETARARDLAELQALQGKIEALPKPKVSSLREFLGA